MLPHHTPLLLNAAPGASVPPTPTTGDEGPACLSCRKRKLRCSREQPSCSQCMRLGTHSDTLRSRQVLAWLINEQASECIYDQRRQKPGLKAGAIENINRRLELLEQRLEKIDNGRGSQRSNGVDPADVHGCVYHASLLLTNHLRENAGVPNTTSGEVPPLQNNSISPTLRSDCRKSSTGEDHDHAGAKLSVSIPPNKRRRIASPQREIDVRHVREGQLPNKLVLDCVISKYFATVHHWIPMLHERRFRARLEDPEDSRNLTVLLHALVAITLKHVDPGDSRIAPREVEEQIRASTDIVTLYSMESLSVEIGQALVMLCFERLGSGDWQKAWPLLGALTRVVDYLQLTIEPDDRRSKPLLPPLTVLDESKSHAEAEERKRVFWNAFLLDRLCSVTCGWSTGFTSDNVSRRLPCNGGIWRRNEEPNTPYFGLWEKRQARMGVPVAYLPTHRASLDEQDMLARSPGNSTALNISQLGAVAYRIEATESLSQVSSFFLQQSVNLTDRNELGNWLTRFKELDLRLVHWKQFLPDRWKESNVSKDAIVRMDPNLTLAHVTHNTSMILLHQHIAYPSATLKSMIKLPNLCSAETCERAAIETSAITSRYLRYTEEMMLNTEFVFCAWIAARILLVHSHYYNTVLNSEFAVIVQNLEEMSRRWRGSQTNIDGRSYLDGTAIPKSDLAGTYALRLQEYGEACKRSHHDPSIAVEILGHSGASALLLSKTVSPLLTSTPSVNGHSEAIAGAENRNTPYSHTRMPSRAARSEREEGVTPMHFPQDSSGSVHPPTATPSPSHPRSAQPNMGGYYGDFSNEPDDLMAMCDALLGQSFTNLDRVIPFDGTAFSFNPNVQDLGYGGYGNS